MRKIYIIIIVLLLPLTINAYGRNPSDAPVEEAQCSESCDGIGAPCEDSFCDSACGTQECCCSLGENTREIRSGRMMDQTEYLVDKIIEQADKEIIRANTIISQAQSLYSSAGQCKSENCNANCDLKSTCAGCEPGGCEEEGLSPVPGDEECRAPGEGQIECCNQESSQIPKPQTLPVIGVSACEPGSPTNLNAQVDGKSVTFSWTGGETVWDRGGCLNNDYSCGDCYPDAAYEVWWKKEGGVWFPSQITQTESIQIDMDTYGKYDYKVVQYTDKDKFYKTYSDISSFEAPKPDNEPKDLRAYPTWGDRCEVLLDWRSGCDPNDYRCKRTEKYNLKYTNTESGSTVTFINLESSSKQVPIAQKPYDAEFSWQVQQEDDEMGKSAWVQDDSNFSLLDSSIAAPNGSASNTEHTITIQWQDNSSESCGSCTESCCSQNNTYQAAIAPRGFITQIVGSGWTYSEWISETSHTFSGLYSGSSYDVFIRRKTGCGTESNWRSISSSTTDCGEGECETIDICEGNKSAAPSQCSKLYSNLCVPERSCNEIGRLQIPSDTCNPNCGTGEECCSVSSVCVGNEGQCTSLGGSPITAEQQEFNPCSNRCGDFTGAFCCVGIDSSTPSGIDLDSDTACCTAAYSLCEPNGCYGSPCPDRRIDASVSAIRGSLAEIRTIRQKIDGYYLQLDNSVPPQLKEVRKRLGECFEEANSGDAVARREKSVKEFVSCHTLMKGNENIASFLPDKNGNPKPYVEGACYGNDYCKVMQVKGRGDELPYDLPCAEDFYCSTWGR